MSDGSGTQQGSSAVWLELSDCWMKLKLELKEPPVGTTSDGQRRGAGGGLGSVMGLGSI